MINSSEALEYTPTGRERILNHPDYHKNQAVNNNQNVYIQSISKGLFDVDIETPRDFWILRVNKGSQEEELYCYQNVAIYSKGKQDGISLQTSFCCESKITHALWCVFHVKDKYESSKTTLNSLETIDTTSVDCICLFDTCTINVHTEYGENYVSSLPFKISAVWSTKYGILIEKAAKVSPQQGIFAMDHTNNMSETEDSDSPIIYSLSHPLDDTRPVLMKHGALSKRKRKTHFKYLPEIRTEIEDYYLDDTNSSEGSGAKKKVTVKFLGQPSKVFQKRMMYD